MYKVTSENNEVTVIDEDELEVYFALCGTDETDDIDVFLNLISVGFKVKMRDNSTVEEMLFVDEDDLKWGEYFPSIDEEPCDHSNRIKNHAGGISFWYCPDCKEDLGNV